MPEVIVRNVIEVYEAQVPQRKADMHHIGPVRKFSFNALLYQLLSE